MKELSNYETIKYLRVLIDCEVLCAKQTALRDYFQNNGKPQAKKPEDCGIHKPEKIDDSSWGIISHVITNPLFFIIAIGGIIVIFIKGGLTREDFFQALFYWIKWDTILLAALFLVFYGFAVLSGYTRRVKYEKKQADYRMQEYLNKEVALEKEYRDKMELYNFHLNLLNKDLESCKSFLSCLYFSGDIYYKYRNIVALSAILEYFESGRAKTYVEAYNIFETEHRLDNIIDAINKCGYKLDLIAQKIDYMQGTLNYMAHQQSAFIDEYRKNYDSLISRIENNEANAAKGIEYAKKSLENSNAMRTIAEDINEKNKYIENTFAEHYTLNPLTGTYSRRI